MIYIDTASERNLLLLRSLIRKKKIPTACIRKQSFDAGCSKHTRQFSLFYLIGVFGRRALHK